MDVKKSDPSFSKLPWSVLILVFILMSVSSLRAQDLSPAEKEEYKRHGSCCGAISVYLACRYYGIDADFEDLVEECGEAEGKDTSLATLARVLRRKGLEAEAVRMTPSELAELQYPFIATVKAEMYTDQHFVFVGGVRSDSVLLIDRTIFAGELPLSAFLDIWQGTGVVVLPSAGNRWKTVRAVLPWAAGLVIAQVLLLLVLQFRKGRAAAKVAILGLCAIGGAFTSPAPRTYASNGPEETAPIPSAPIVADKALVDLGKHLSGSIIERRFQLRNAAAKPYDLVVGRKSCVCATAALEKARLLPGETTLLDVAILALGPRAKRTATVEVKTGDPTTLSLVLSMDYEIGQVFWVKPARLCVGALAMGTETTRYLRVGYDKDYGISGLVIGCSAPWIETRLVRSSDLPVSPEEDFFDPDKPNKALFVQVVMKPPTTDPLLEFRETLSIVSQGGTVSTVEVPVEGFLIGRATVAPRKVTVVKTTPQRDGKAGVKIRNCHAVPITEVELISGMDCLRYDVEEERDGKEYSLSFRTDGALPAGCFKGKTTVRIVYRDSHAEKVVLPTVVLAL